MKAMGSYVQIRTGTTIYFYDDEIYRNEKDFGNALKKADGVTQGYSAVSQQIPQNTAKIMFCITGHE